MPRSPRIVRNRRKKIEAEIAISARYAVSLRTSPANGSCATAAGAATAACEEAMGPPFTVRTEYTLKRVGFLANRYQTIGVVTRHHHKLALCFASRSNPEMFFRIVV